MSTNDSATTIPSLCSARICPVEGCQESSAAKSGRYDRDTRWFCTAHREMEMRRRRRLRDEGKPKAAPSDLRIANALGVLPAGQGGHPVFPLRRRSPSRLVAIDIDELSALKAHVATRAIDGEIDADLPT